MCKIELDVGRPANVVLWVSSLGKGYCILFFDNFYALFGLSVLIDYMYAVWG